MQCAESVVVLRAVGSVPQPAAVDHPHMTRITARKPSQGYNTHNDRKSDCLGGPMRRTRGFQFVLLMFSFAVALSFAAISLPALAQQVIATVPVGNTPIDLAVNSVTNKIYVANALDPTVTVIDGSAFSTLSISVGTNPVSVAVNSVTDKIYAA